MEERKDGHLSPAIMTEKEQKERSEIATSYASLSQRCDRIAEMIRSGQPLTDEEVKALKKVGILTKTRLEMAKEILTPPSQSSTPKSE